MSLIAFGIIGAGWRAEFYLRIAEQLPNRFRIAGMVVRNEQQAAGIEKKWGVKTFRNIDDMLSQADLSFVVVSVPRAVAPSIVLELANKGVAVLCETPPADRLEDLIAFNEAVGSQAKVQIAEQYLFQPNHAARLNIVRSGKLGAVSQAQVSAAHDYHGISLLRQYLDLHYEDATIRAISFTSPIVDGPNREGDPKALCQTESSQVIASFEFGDKLGVYDFTGDQYFSWIRSPRLLVRGEKGEINNHQVKYLLDYSTPVDLELNRLHAGADGNLEGFYLKGILCGEHYVYHNPYIPGRLTDDEIAIATCLERMEQYVSGGPGFYSLAEASQDHYLTHMLNKALETKEPVRTSRQVWAI
ncbi:gfo/Idh/MocA family oxidoreductase [Paenibacillus psychroresistens]|uniref:Gfo/Idh/MocA family oxidoreductase n=1 Tax=Paenibacillus psychroresistens TaxID=1778678 RepID=A0A6B8RS78_9BACL|nr:Gfo/Idh/MocA family oxidoreductase [Paenibacillus psychroresistens]QGQ99260.1 gfo/Idh/MocA family oxidoreductase [Paenibacillus psychroresistens]